jgi:hypothetical protein
MIEIMLCEWLRLSAVKTVAPNIFAITLPESHLYPAIKVTTINADIDETFDGLTGEETALIQLEFWAKTPEILQLIKQALLAFFNELSDEQPRVLSIHSLREQPSYEPDSRIFKKTLDLTLNYKT